MNRLRSQILHIALEIAIKAAHKFGKNIRQNIKPNPAFQPATDAISIHQLCNSCPDRTSKEDLSFSPDGRARYISWCSKHQKPCNQVVICSRKESRLWMKN